MNKFIAVIFIILCCLSTRGASLSPLANQSEAARNARLTSFVYTVAATCKDNREILRAIRASFAALCQPAKHYVCAITASHRQEPQLAIPHWQKVLAYFPTFQLARLNLAKCLMAVNQHPQALTELQRLLLRTPLEYPYDTWLLTAQCLIAAGQHLAAETAVRQALLWNPASCDAKFLLMQCLFSQNSLSEAAAIAQELLNQRPQDKTLWTILLKHEIQRENWREAAALLDIANSLEVDEPQLARLRPFVFLHAKLPLTAAEAALAPNVLKLLDTTQRLELAEVFVNFSLNRQARVLLADDAHLTAPQARQRTLLLARLDAAEAAAWPEKQLEVWSRLLTIQPRHPLVLLENARAHLRLKRFDQAEPLLLKLLDLDHSNYTALVELANLYLLTHRPQQARPYLQKAHQLYPSPALEETIKQLK